MQACSRTPHSCAEKKRQKNGQQKRWRHNYVRHLQRKGTATRELSWILENRGSVMRCSQYGAYCRELDQRPSVDTNCSTLGVYSLGYS